MSSQPSDLLMEQVARRYFLAQETKSAIAHELGLSRFRVARLLDAARDSGMVHIEIRSASSLNSELSQQLQRLAGLQHCLVVDATSADAVQLRAQLGAAAAGLLTEIAEDGDVLGVAWSRSLSAVAEALTSLPRCDVVQLTGALSHPDTSDVLELVRHFARVGGGAAQVFYAPFVTPDSAMADTLRRQPEVARARKLAARARIAMVGMGAWRKGQSTIYESLAPEDRDCAETAGICAEISGVFLDSKGRTCTPKLSSRIIGVSASDLRKVDTVIGIVYDDAKAAATVAALRSGLITSLVTHASLAGRVIELIGDDGTKPAGRRPRRTKARARSEASE